MSIKLASAALLAAVLGASAALSQTVAQVGGPKELPPAGYKSMQYIDSRGCVFLRAGLGGTVTWVPRVGQDRKVLCGYPPTMGGGKQIQIATVPDSEAAKPAAVAPKVVAEATPAPVLRQTVRQADYVPPPARVGRVIPTVTPSAPMVRTAAAPLVMAVQPGVSVAAAEGSVGCPASAPRLQRLPLTNGGTVLVCTPGDGSIRELRPPVFAQGAGVGAAIEEAPARVAEAAPRVAAAPVRVARAATVPVADAGVRLAAETVKVPEGYELVWDDDRLNPLRGVGTVQGQAMQDQVWTRKVPAQLVSASPKLRREAARERMAGAVLTVSSMSAPAAPVAARAGGYYVQAGSFGVPANAQGAMARLAAAGLPVATGRAKGLTVVMAGPFGSPSEAASARALVRAAGFGDAFVR